jgi:hypothetical protein
MERLMRLFMQSLIRSGKWFLLLLASSFCFAVQADRITGPLDSSQMVALTGDVHSFAQARFDLGHVDSAKMLHGVTLAFKPSAVQQAALDKLLAQQQDRSSPNYHKWLSPAQFAERFGMTQDDINRVSAWLESQGFTVTSIANSRNQISFDGTVAQVESVFRTEIHDYLVDGEIHFANATNPSVPAALAGVVLTVGHLHNFAPKPRIRIQSHFTSDLTGNHFLTPGDFATIYDIPSGMDGTGQSIAIVGQSAVNPTDLVNFRNAAGLAAKATQMILYPSSSVSAHCSGDEDESDLDLEWSGGVASNANIIFVYAGLVGSDSCALRNNDVWNALQQSVDNNYAPVISISYGFCEQGLPAGFPQQVQGWAQEANSQGQTIVAATGDSGAADCDGPVASATQGFAVDIPAAIPEVTGMGGNEFFGDPPSTSTTTYWEGASGSDTISSALTHIPEEGWNDTVADGVLSASGGGASTLFAKPTWQAGVGVPNDLKRDVPDLSLSASADHDSYLICSPTDPAGNPSCTNGFRDSSTQGYLDPIGGTSCAAPSFAGIVALLNQSLGASGLGNINPQLYSLAASSPLAFNDVTTGNNIVPCTSGTPSCPTSGTSQFGFSAGIGYDQVTGLGSVDANELFTAWPSSRSSSSITITPSTTSVYTGTSVTFSVAVTPTAGVGTVSFSTSTGGGPPIVLGTATLNIPYQPSNPNSGTATFTTTALPAGSNSVTATYQGDASHSGSVSVPATVTVTVPFTMTPSPSSFNVPSGESAISTITIAPTSGFTGTVNFTNSTASNPGSCTANLPAGALCNFNPGSVTLDGNPAHSMPVTLSISTAANMALPSGAQAITVTGTSGSTMVTTTVNLTLTPTNQSYTLATTSGAGTFPVAVGGTAAVSVTVKGMGSPISFVTSSLTALPLTYTCTGVPALPTSEISCQLPNNGQPTNASTVTFNLVTTAVTTQLSPQRGRSIFYALLLPGLFGVVFVVGSRTRGLRLLGMIMVLFCSTLGLGSCGGSSNGNNSLKNPGTPAGSYAVTISATTGGPNPLTVSLLPPIMLQVGQ